jgi:phosphate-selective porin OprO/OprP
MSVRPSLVFVLLMLVATRAAAQQATPAPQAVPPFVVQSDDGDNRLQVAGLAQMDGRFANEDVLDTFLMRRLRISLQGRVARVFEFYLNPDFAGGVLTLFDGYVDTRFSDAFRVRVGKAKVPFGLERLQSAANLIFVERGFPTALLPNRDVGIQLLGDVAGGIVSYGASLTNGTADGGSGDVDTNEGKDVAGRVIVRPWVRTPANPLSGVAVGIAASAGDQPSTLAVLRTSTQQTFFSYAAGTAGVDRRTRLSPQGAYYFGPFGGFAEYVRSTGDVRRGTTTGELTHTAWQVAGSWVMTGEAASERGVRPRNPFDPSRGTWGALQLAARYSALHVDADAVSLGFAAAGASTDAANVAVSLNWYLNPFVRWLVTGERTVFDGEADGPRPAENALLFRAQLAF